MTQAARAAILAGGRGSRMGGVQKALIAIDGRAILDHQLDVLRPRFAEVVVVLAADGTDGDEAPFVARGLAVLRDPVAGCGPLAGLAAALAWAGADPVFALGCDMPFIVGGAIDLVLASAQSDVALPVVGGRAQPLFARYSPRCAEIVRREMAAGRLRLRELPDAASAAGLTVDKIDERKIRNADPDLRSFVNLNRQVER